MTVLRGLARDTIIIQAVPNLWPYTFISDEGRNEGFSIDILSTMLKRLGKPYKVKMISPDSARACIMEGITDVAIDFPHKYDSISVPSHANVSLLTNSVVYPKGAEHITSIEDIKDHKVMVRKNSFFDTYFKGSPYRKNITAVTDMKGEMMKMSKENKGQMIWNTLSLRYLLKKYDLNNLDISPISSPQNPFTFITRDEKLTHALDSTFNLMEQEGAFNDIYHKWYMFDDNNKHNYSHWNHIVVVVFVFISLCISLILMLLWSRRINKKELAQNNYLSKYLRAGDVSLWIQNIRENTITIYDKKLHRISEVSFLKVKDSLNKDDVEKMLAAGARVTKGESEREVVEMSLSHQYHDKAAELSITVLERDEKGIPTRLLGVQRIVENTKLQKERAEREMRRFQSIFDTSYSEICMYDKDGYMVMVNNKGLQKFGLKDIDQLIKQKINIKDVPQFKDLNLSEVGGLAMTNINNKMGIYYRSSVTPIYDENFNLEYLCVRGTDVTETAETVNRMRKSSRELEAYSNQINEMVTMVETTMSSSDSRMLTYNPYTRKLTLLKNLDEVEQEMDELEIFSIVSKEGYEDLIKSFIQLNKFTKELIQIPIHSVMKNTDGSERYLLCRAFPMYDERGNLRFYVGTLTNESQLISTRLQLEEERKKAKENDIVKNAFLKNMSYEIRTPLNTVVGYAEMLTQDHSPEDDEIFISGIKKYTNDMLLLVNDALRLSELDSGMVTSEKQTIDISQQIEYTCRAAWDKYSKEGVSLDLVNSYESFICSVDYQNLEDVLIRLISNAAKFTDSGNISVRYDYINGSLVVNIADTGCGMSKEILSRINERFLRSEKEESGTGLGIPICQSELKLMGGTLNFESKESEGTSAWVSVPCKLISAQHKKVVYVSN